MTMTTTTTTRSTTLRPTAANMYHKRISSSRRRALISFMLVAMAFVDVGSAFLPMRRTTCQLQHQRRLLIVDDIQKSRLADSAAKSDEAAAVTEDASNKEDIRSMRLSEIQKELQRLNVSSKDCFDRDSLTHRLLEARQQLQQQQQQSLPVEDSQPEQSTTTESSKTTTTSTDETRTAPTATSTTTATDKTYTKQQLDQEVAALSVRELRAELGAAGKRWAGMLEKRDLVDAVVNLRQQAANFSVTGRMQPGQVTDLTAEELELELQSTSTLVLLDVYATWCGPCKMMIPHLEGTAAALGTRVRVGKLDSDKYNQAAGNYKVQGLPTMLLLRGDEIVDRVEGMLTQEQLMPWVERHLQ